MFIYLLFVYLHVCIYLFYLGKREAFSVLALDYYIDLQPTI